MTDQQIKQHLTDALATFHERDQWLLAHDVNEPCISHKLAEYLQDHFCNYHVDCEYNGNIHREGRRKRIILLKEELRQLGSIRPTEEDLNLIERLVYPDIIIHRRGSNSKNLCIIEVKKDTNTLPLYYDDIKLKAYTSTENGNDLKYQLGVFICFNTRHRALDHTIQYYKNGTVI